MTENKIALPFKWVPGHNARRPLLPSEMRTTVTGTKRMLPAARADMGKGKVTSISAAPRFQLRTMPSASTLRIASAELLVIVARCRSPLRSRASVLACRSIARAIQSSVQNVTSGPATP